jgi:hypothetical protein
MRMTEERYEVYSEGFQAGKEAGKEEGKEAGRLAALEELGIYPDYMPENAQTKPYKVNGFSTGNEEIPMSYATQNARILAYLRGGGALTPKDALSMFGSFRLSARIFELREEGWPIDMQYVQVGPRTWVALFSMERGAKRGKPRNPSKQMELSI